MLSSAVFLLMGGILCRYLLRFISIAAPSRKKSSCYRHALQEDALLVIQKPLDSKAGPGVTFSVVSDNIIGAAHALLSKTAKGSRPISSYSHPHRP